MRVNTERVRDRLLGYFLPRRSLIYQPICKIIDPRGDIQHLKNYYSGNLLPLLNYCLSGERYLYDRIALKNLSFLIDRNSEVIDDAVMSRIHQRLSLVLKGSIYEDENNSLLQLYLNIGLILSKEKVYDEIEGYIGTFLRNNLTSKFQGNGLCFIHIPKCAGTSLTKYLSHKYYKNGAERLLPNYWNGKLLEYVLKKRLGLPFVSTNHLQVDLDVIDRSFEKVTVIRDPVKRVLSMYRQSHHGLYKGYNLHLLPKYGSDINRYSADGFVNFVNSLKLSDLKAQLYSFDQSGKKGLAIERIRRNDVQYLNLDTVNDYSIIKLSMGSIRYSDIPRGLNSSIKNESVPADSLECLNGMLVDEIELVESL